jgi:hypothetical protein
MPHLCRSLRGKTADNSSEAFAEEDGATAPIASNPKLVTIQMELMRIRYATRLVIFIFCCLPAA